MKITRKQLTPVIAIVAVIAAFALLFATYTPVRSNLGTDENFSLKEPSGEDLTEDIADEPFRAFSSQGRSMYVSYGGVITVKDDATNAVLWTNTAEEDHTLIYGESQASISPLNIVYRYNGETDTTFYSDADAVQSNQYTVAYNEDQTRLQVTYLFGEAGDSGLMPMALTRDFMEKQILGKLSDEDGEYLLERYVLYPKGTADSNLIKEYPGMTREDIYYLESPGSYVIQSRISSYLSEAGFTVAQYKEQCEITGEEITVYNENFMLTVEYWLDGGDIMVNIPGESIYFHPEHPLTTINLNGAATYAENGDSGKYLLPAGSGALQSFSQLSERNNNYTYYGKDYLNTVLTAQENDFPLPVYGVIRENDRGLLAVIESGAESAVLNERFTNGASQLTLSLRLLEYGDASVTAQQTSTVYCGSAFKGNFTVRYRVTEAGADAIELANQYRELLVEQDAIPTSRQSQENALIEMVGNVPYTYQWLGLFPVHKQIMLTDWGQTLAITQSLVDAGIMPAVKLSGYNTNGLYCQTPGNYKFIGSAKDRSAFLDFAAESGINTYLDVGLAYRYTGSSGIFSGYSAGRHSARAAGNDNAVRQIVSKSTGNSSAKASAAQIVSPKMFSKYAASYTEKLDAAFGISIGDAFCSLNTDFFEKTPYNREDSLAALRSAVNTFGENRSVMGRNPIAPMLNSLALTEDLTLTGHAEYAFSEYVPFVQTVLHGHVNYTTDSLNSHNDYQLALLEAVSFGSTPKYAVTYSFDRDVMSTEYDFLYFTDWGNWRETIIADVLKVNELYKTVADAEITGYSRTDGLSVTRYSNGVSVYVNFTDEAISVDGLTVPAMDFQSAEND